MPRTKQSARTKQIAREKTSRRRNFNRKNGKFVGISIPFVRRAKPVKITDLTVDLTIDDDEISDLTNDSSSSTSSRVSPWKSGDWCWLIPEYNDVEDIDLTNHDYEISYLTNNDDEISDLTNESRGKKQTK